MKPSWRPSSKVRVAPWPAKKTKTRSSRWIFLPSVNSSPSTSHDALAGGIAVEQLADVLALEAEFGDQRLFDAIGVVDGVAQFGPVLIVVDADDHGPALAIEARCASAGTGAAGAVAARRRTRSSRRRRRDLHELALRRRRGRCNPGASAPRSPARARARSVCGCRGRGRCPSASAPARAGRAWRSIRESGRPNPANRYSTSRICSPSAVTCCEDLLIARAVRSAKELGLAGPPPWSSSRLVRSISLVRCSSVQLGQHRDASSCGWRWCGRLRAPSSRPRPVRDSFTSPPSCDRAEIRRRVRRSRRGCRTSAAAPASARYIGMRTVVEGQSDGFGGEVVAEDLVAGRRPAHPAAGSSGRMSPNSRQDLVAVELRAQGGHVGFPLFARGAPPPRVANWEKIRVTSSR